MNLADSPLTPDRGPAKKVGTDSANDRSAQEFSSGRVDHASTVGIRENGGKEIDGDQGYVDLPFRGKDPLKSSPLRTHLRPHENRD